MWQIATNGTIFTAPLRERRKSIVDRYDRLPPPSDWEQEKLDAEREELDRFEDGLSALIKSNVDPTTILPKAFEPNLGPAIPDHYIFQVGNWQAFFRVDSINKLAKGVYIRNLNDRPAAQLKSILEHIP